MNQDLINKTDAINDNIYFIANNEEISVKSLSDKISKGSFTAYICQDNVCSAPIESIDEFIEFMRQ